jgi:hypothetical protein
MAAGGRHCTRGERHRSSGSGQQFRRRKLRETAFAGVATTAAKELARSWDWGTGHLNVQIELTREQHADYFLDTIIEGSA